MIITFYAKDIDDTHNHTRYLLAKGYNLSRLIRSFLEDKALSEGYTPNTDRPTNPSSIRPIKPILKRGTSND